MIILKIKTFKYIAEKKIINGFVSSKKLNLFFSSKTLLNENKVKDTRKIKLGIKFIIKLSEYKFSYILFLYKT